MLSISRSQAAASVDSKPISKSIHYLRVVSVIARKDLLAIWCGTTDHYGELQIIISLDHDYSCSQAPIGVLRKNSDLSMAIQREQRSLTV
jgi:hypothetical protein